MPYPDERCAGCTLVHYCNFNSLFVFANVDPNQRLFIPNSCPLGVKDANKAVQSLEEKKKLQNTVKVICLN